MSPDLEPSSRSKQPIWPRPSGLEWALLLLGLVAVNHYAWLLDDAFIFFRYADNWVLLENGLVYNRGEYVEGFSSPAWLLIMSALRSTGADWWHIVRALGLLIFVAFWWALVRLNRELSPEPRADAQCAPVINFPLIYLAPCYGALCYFTSGVETPLVQLVAILFAAYLVRPETWTGSVAVGAAALVRPELALASALAFAYAWSTTRRFPRRTAAVALMSVGGWVVFRVIYYAELLPNTFYLKDLADWGQGFVYLWETMATYWVPAVAIAFGAIVFGLRRRAVPIRATARLAMLGISAIIALYLVRVGGDPRHYRYLAFSFCLAAASLAGLGEQALVTFGSGIRDDLRGRWLVAGAGLVLALVVATRFPPQLGAHPIRGAVPHTMVRGINDAAYHRNHPRMRYPTWSTRAIEQGLPIPMGEDDYATVSTESWCEWAWRTPHVRVIQNLGLTDPILARVDMRPDRPAHKSGLQALAEDIRAVHERYTAAPGMYRMAVEQGVAGEWIARNLESIEIIERKIYNRHDPIENLGLALTPIDRIEP